MRQSGNYTEESREVVTQEQPTYTLFRWLNYYHIKEKTKTKAKKQNKSTTKTKYMGSSLSDKGPGHSKFNRMRPVDQVQIKLDISTEEDMRSACGATQRVRSPRTMMGELMEDRPATQIINNNNHLY